MCRQDKMCVLHRHLQGTCMFCANKNPLGCTHKSLRIQGLPWTEILQHSYRGQLIWLQQGSTHLNLWGIRVARQPSSEKAATFGGSILPNWCIQTLYSSPIPLWYSPISLPFALKLDKAGGHQAYGSFQPHLYM